MISLKSSASKGPSSNYGMQLPEDYQILPALHGPYPNKTTVMLKSIQVPYTIIIQGTQGFKLLHASTLLQECPVSFPESLHALVGPMS